MGGRAGRKRKTGKREPNGRPQRTPQDLKTKTSRQPHRRALAAEMRTDERAESPLGRLYLRHELARARKPREFDPARMLDADCFDAGSRYAYVVGEYRATIEAPRSTSGSGRGLGCDGLCDIKRKLALEEVICACRKRRDAYDEAFETLARAGRNPSDSRRMLMAVNRVVVGRLEPLEEEIVYLVAGLRALARHFGLTRGPRRAHGNNAN